MKHFLKGAQQKFLQIQEAYETLKKQRGFLIKFYGTSLVYLELGLWHVLDLAALDHLLLIAAFSAPYGFNSLKKLIWWTTLFTIGHSLSLLGNYFYNLNISSNWIELLISVSILIACIPLFRKAKPFGRTLLFECFDLFLESFMDLDLVVIFGMMVPQESGTKALISLP